MDLTPFAGINPCGYQGLRVTQIKDFDASTEVSNIEQQLAQQIIVLLQKHLAMATREPSELK
jgi:lipoyl(octanoyl) transferase